MNPSRPSNIIVIGAGVVGCAVACELARRGAAVRMLDDRPPGMGATQASAGMLAPFTESKDRNDAFLELAVRSLDLYDGFVKSVMSRRPARRSATSGPARWRWPRAASTWQSSRISPIG